jgi:ADP-heptose:LPS heptosyltransferase
MPDNILKKIELRFKDLVSSLIRKILEQPHRDIPSSIDRILFFRYDVLGDMILSLPILKKFRDLHPMAEIEVLCSKRNYKILVDSGFADHIYIYEKNILSIIRLVFDLRKNNYDLIINLVAHASFTFGLIARLLGSKAVRLAGHQEQFTYLYNHPVQLPGKNSIHMLKVKFILCQEIIGEIPENLPTPWVTYGAEIKEIAKQVQKSILQQLSLKKARGNLVAVNLSAGMARREWPLDKYARFLENAIKKYDKQIEGWVIIPNPADPDKTEDLLRLVDDPKLVNIEAQSDFRVILELLPAFKLLLTPDTSLVHAASAMGIPVCVLSIGQSADVWNPVGVPFVLVQSDDYYSLADLQVHKVGEGFQKLIDLISI